MLVKVHLEEAVLDDLFELDPLSQYEMYAMGQGPYRQVACSQESFVSVMLLLSCLPPPHPL